MDLEVLAGVGWYLLLHLSGFGLNPSCHALKWLLSEQRLTFGAQNGRDSLLMEEKAICFVCAPDIFSSAHLSWALFYVLKM